MASRRTLWGSLQRSPEPLAGGKGNIPSQRTSPLSAFRPLLFSPSGLPISVDPHNVVDGVAPLSGASLGNHTTQLITTSRLKPLFPLLYTCTVIFTVCIVRCFYNRLFCSLYQVVRLSSRKNVNKYLYLFTMDSEIGALNSCYIQTLDLPQCRNLRETETTTHACVNVGLT